MPIGPEIPREAGEAFDRVGARAWSLASWVTGDDALSRSVVVDAFAACARRSRQAWVGDAELLQEVRRQALDQVGALTPAAASTASMQASQREVVELAAIAGLGPDAIAQVLGAARSEVVELLRTGLRELAGSGLVRAQV